MRLKSNFRWTLFFAALGFLGAVLFYSPYLGLNAQLGIECVPCPHVTGLWDSNIKAFLRLTLAGGLLNALLFIVIGWFFLFTVRVIKGFRTL